MARHGLLVGSLLTAVPVFLIHLPLAFETDGWPGTTWQDALVTWGVLLVAAPFQRYLIGTLLIDTGGSTLAAGLIHASINAAGAMVVVPGGWQIVPALILLTARCRRLPSLARALGDRRVRPGRHPGVRSRPAHRSRSVTVTTVVAGSVAGNRRPRHRPATTVLLHLVPGALPTCSRSSCFCRRRPQRTRVTGMIAAAAARAQSRRWLVAVACAASAGAQQPVHRGRPHG